MVRYFVTLLPSSDPFSRKNGGKQSCEQMKIILLGNEINFHHQHLRSMEGEREGIVIEQSGQVKHLSPKRASKVAKLWLSGGIRLVWPSVVIVNFIPFYG